MVVQNVLDPLNTQVITFKAEIIRPGISVRFFQYCFGSIFTFCFICCTENFWLKNMELDFGPVRVGCSSVCILDLLLFFGSLRLTIFFTYSDWSIDCAKEYHLQATDFYFAQCDVLYSFWPGISPKFEVCITRPSNCTSRSAAGKVFINSVF